MATWLIGGILLVALVFAARHVFHSFSGGGCSGCPGGCGGCASAHGQCSCNQMAGNGQAPAQSLHH